MVGGLSLADVSVHILTIPLLFILVTSIYFTFKTRFIQFRMLPRMIKLLIASMFGRNKGNSDTIPAHKALFTAMSTTLGIGNITGPVVAIRLGGPGALLIMLIIMLFGAATIFAEVTFAMDYRRQDDDGFIAGGPMQYLKAACGVWLARIYAFFAAMLLVVWSSNQSNTLADILQVHHISPYVTGIIISGLVTFYLVSGIKKIGDLSSKLVPMMFFLYCFVSLWIVFANFSQLPEIFKLMFDSMFSATAAGGAAAGFGIQKMLRWGLAKGTQAAEAGIGSQAIPHSKSMSKQSLDQGILSMFSVYSVAFICLLSGLTTLLTGTWNNPHVGLGINQIAEGFAGYIPSSSIILAACAFMFAFGTILGNAFNGSQCYLYLTKKRWVNVYFLIIAVVVFWGAVAPVALVWTISDFFIIPVALSNIIGLLWLSFKRPELLKN